MNAVKKTKKNTPTKERILEAAKQLFIQKGFSATSMNEIAKSAAVTQSLIHHHFKTKSNIWTEVKTHILSQNTDTVDFEINPEEYSLKECLEKLIRARVDLYTKNPDLIRLMAWQSLEEEENRNLAGGTAASPDQWIFLIEELKKQHKIAENIDVNMALLMIYGSISAYFQKNRFLHAPVSEEAYLLFLIEGLVKILKPKN